MRFMAHWNLHTLLGPGNYERQLMPTMFGNDSLARLLDLTSSQRNQIRIICDTADKRSRGVQHDIAKTLHALTLEHFAAILRELETEQRSRFEEWHGLPIDWFDAKLKNGELLKQLKDGIPGPNRLRVRGPIDSPVEIQVAVADFASRRLSPTGLSRLAVEIVDLLWFDVMRSPALHELIGLSDSQRQKLADVMKEVDRRAVQAIDSLRERLEQIIGNADELAPLFDGI